jgi:DNA invertase Pin-like site-specific DNA recombinase
VLYSILSTNLTEFWINPVRLEDILLAHGYARVSRQDGQDTALQIQALKATGVERVFEEKASGGRWDRPPLQRALEQLRPGDVFVVWNLDRLSRSLKDLLTLMEKMAALGAGFRSLTEAIDTTTPAGRMMMQMVGSLPSLNGR